MTRLVRWVQIGLVMVVATYATLMIVIAIVQPKAVEPLPDSGGSVTASQLQAEAGLLAPSTRRAF